jgi:signal transduction histidine kinase
MNTAILIAGLVLAAALAAALRTTAPNAARSRPEPRTLQPDRRARQPGEAMLRAGEQEREWLAVLAHELRSPIGAIGGYAELLREGTLGRLDSRAADAVTRMASAAAQISALLHGIERITRIHDDTGEPAETIDLRTFATEAVETLRCYADARNVDLRIDSFNATAMLPPTTARCTITLALDAALKVSSGRTITVTAPAGNTAAIIIRNTALHSGTDDPATPNTGTPMSAAGLRIALARSFLEPLGGSAELMPNPAGADLLVRFPATGTDTAVRRLASTEYDP